MLQLFTDTSANLPVALTKQHHITVVPFSYTVDGKETDYPDDVDFDGAAFYGAMRRGAPRRGRQDLNGQSRPDGELL